MSRLRPWCAPMVLLTLAPTIRADDKPSGSPWAIDRTLTVTPSAVPAQAFQYRLLPLKSELKEGNASPIYLRLAHEQNDAARKYLAETPKPWNAGSIDQMPLKEAREYLEKLRYMRQQFELGARRRSCDWSYTLDAGDPIGLLLPDVQTMRNYVPLLVLQTRVALADNDFQSASRRLETGFAVASHVGEAPFLISGLVSIAMAAQFTNTVADFIERPGSPNLYWPLAALPHPFADLRQGLDFEYRVVEMMFPDLDDLDRERSPAEWDRLLRTIRSQIRQLSLIPEEGKPSAPPAWMPKELDPQIPASKSPWLAEARTQMARARRLNPAAVAAMPPSQVLVLHFADVYHQDRDSVYRATCLPYLQSFRMYTEALESLNAAPTSEGRAMSKLILSAFNRVMSAQARLERHLTVLRVVEALRVYAAAHDGKLPEKLSDVAEVFVSDDPGTSKPFEFSHDGAAAVITSQVPGDPVSNNGIRYRITVRK